MVGHQLSTFFVFLVCCPLVGCGGAAVQATKAAGQAAVKAQAAKAAGQAAVKAQAAKAVGQTGKALPSQSFLYGDDAARILSNQHDEEILHSLYAKQFKALPSSQPNSPLLVNPDDAAYVNTDDSSQAVSQVVAAQNHENQKRAASTVTGAGITVLGSGATIGAQQTLQDSKEKRKPLYPSFPLPRSRASNVLTLGGRSLQLTNRLLSSNRTVQAEDGNANLRNHPSTEVAIVSKIPNGTSVNILDKQTNSSGQLWYKVQVNGQVGWIYSKLLK